MNSRSSKRSVSSLESEDDTKQPESANTSTVEFGKRYKLSFASSKEEKSLSEFASLQYTFKPANIDKDIGATLQLPVKEGTSECILLHKRKESKNSEENVIFKGKLLENEENKDMILKFDPMKQEFSLHPIEHNVVNLRMKLSIDVSSLSSSSSACNSASAAAAAHPTSSNVDKRLAKMVKKKPHKKQQAISSSNEPMIENEQQMKSSNSVVPQPTASSSESNSKLSEDYSS
jgi:hypothetical protein